MRIIFAGTPEAAVPTLKALLSSSHEVALVITRPPARRGRGKTMYPSPVAEVAATCGVELLETTTLKTPDIAQRIENEMQYPGQVKVVVIRESRAIGIAK